MTREAILEEIKKLPMTDRLAVMEASLHLIRLQLQQLESSQILEPRQQLVLAAETLLPDYVHGGELTAFTALDGEDFYAVR